MSKDPDYQEDWDFDLNHISYLYLFFKYFSLNP